MKKQKGEVLIATVVVILVGLFATLVSNPGGTKVADAGNAQVAEATK